MQPASLRLQLNPSLGVPLYRQIMDGVKELVATGMLKPGDQLPSIRELSAQLRINPSSAVKAYGELRHDGVIDIDHGRGTFVAERKDAVQGSRDELISQAIDTLIGRARTLGLEDVALLELFERRLRMRKGAKR